MPVYDHFRNFIRRLNVEVYTTAERHEVATHALPTILAEQLMEDADEVHMLKRNLLNHCL